MADLLHEIAKENNIVKPIDICTDEDTLNSPLEQTFENLDIEFAEDERLEVKKDNTDIYVKNLNKHIEVKYPFVCGNTHLGEIIGNIFENS